MPAALGNPVIYVGAKTGRDGIHGASLLASAEFTEESKQKRPNVQVGDPFLEKLLLEACLEAMATGAIVGIQDMGAAGLTSTSCEMASRGGSGHRDGTGTRAAARNRHDSLRNDAQRIAGAHAAGRGAWTRARGVRRIPEVGAGRGGDRPRHFGRHFARCCITARWSPPFRPERWRMKRPVYRRPAKPPLINQENGAAEAAGLVERAVLAKSGADLTANFRAAAGSSSDRVQALDFRAIRPHGANEHDRIAGRGGCSGDTPERYPPRAGPFHGRQRAVVLHSIRGRGAMHAVAEAARNVAAVGARPWAATNCLNFGNPEKPEVMWQFSEAVDGIAEACSALAIPITGGNVSFYNDTLGKSIDPTPILGVLGVLEDASRAITMAFRSQGDAIVLLDGLGDRTAGERPTNEPARVCVVRICPHYRRSGWRRSPGINLDAEKRLIKALIAMAGSGLLASAHDLSDGGMAVALAECAFAGNNVGADVAIESDLRGRVGAVWRKWRARCGDNAGNLAC